MPPSIGTADTLLHLSSCKHSQATEHTIDSECDIQYLQKDLDTIFHWAESWQILLNIEKYVII